MLSLWLCLLELEGKTKAGHTFTEPERVRLTWATSVTESQPGHTFPETWRAHALPDPAWGTLFKKPSRVTRLQTFEQGMLLLLESRTGIPSRPKPGYTYFNPARRGDPALLHSRCIVKCKILFVAAGSFCFQRRTLFSGKLFRNKLLHL